MRHIKIYFRDNTFYTLKCVPSKSLSRICKVKERFSHTSIRKIQTINLNLKK